MKVMKVSERMRGYRSRKQAAGLRLVQIWAPALGCEALRACVRHQCRIVNASASEDDALAFIERASDWDEDAQR